MSLNISISHSRSFEMTVEDAMCKSLLVFHCDYVCISYGSEMFNVKYWRDLEILGRVDQGDLIWRHSIDRI